MRERKPPRGIRLGTCLRLLLVSVSLAAAASAPTASAADKVTVKGHITTAAELNPDYRGRPSPVALIVFQLKSADAFKNADFFALYDPDTSVLGGDLIARSQRILQPGQSLDIEEEFDEGTRFIGFVAAFRDIEHAQWRGLVELPQKGFFKNLFKKSKLLIDLQALEVAARIE